MGRFLLTQFGMEQNPQNYSNCQTSSGTPLRESSEQCYSEDVALLIAQRKEERTSPRRKPLTTTEKKTIAAFSKQHPTFNQKSLADLFNVDRTVMNKIVKEPKQHVESRPDSLYPLEWPRQRDPQGNIHNCEQSTMYATLGPFLDDLASLGAGIDLPHDHFKNNNETQQQQQQDPGAVFIGSQFESSNQELGNFVGVSGGTAARSTFPTTLEYTETETDLLEPFDWPYLASWINTEEAEFWTRPDSSRQESSPNARH